MSDSKDGLDLIWGFFLGLGISLVIFIFASGVLGYNTKVRSYNKNCNNMILMGINRVSFNKAKALALANEDPEILRRDLLIMNQEELANTSPSDLRRVGELASAIADLKNFQFSNDNFYSQANN